MKILCTIIWHYPLCGCLTALLAAMGGIFLIATVVAAPIGIGLLQFAKFLLAPFHYHVVNQSVVKSVDQIADLDLSVIDVEEKTNWLWKHYSDIIKIFHYPYGFVLVCLLVIQTAVLCCTVVGIPYAMILWKSLGVAFNPAGKICVNDDQFREIKIANYEMK